MSNEAATAKDTPPVEDRSKGDLFEELWNAGDAPAEKTDKAAAPEQEGGDGDGDGQEPGQTQEGKQQPTEAKSGSPDKSDEGDGGQQPDDWRSALPDHIRAEITKIEEREQEAQRALADERQARAALQGRVAPLQRQLTEHQKELAQLRGKEPPKGAKPEGGQASAASANQDDLDSFFDSEEWKQYAKDFPAEAKLMRDAMQRSVKRGEMKVAQLESQLKALEPQLSTVNETLERLRIAEERAELSRQHPDWEEFNQSAEFWGWFNDYRESLPPDLGDRLHDKEYLTQQFQSAKFVAHLLTSYKRDRALAEQYLAAEQGGNAPDPEGSAQTPPKETTPQNAQPQGASARARLAAAPAQGKGGNPPATRVSLDSMPKGDAFEYLWNNT